MSDGRIIRPNGTGELVGADGGLAQGVTMKTEEIGGAPVPVCQDVDKQPGLTPQKLMTPQGLDLGLLLNFVNALSGCLHATMREVVGLRAQLDTQGMRIDDAESAIESASDFGASEADD